MILSGISFTAIEMKDVDPLFDWIVEHSGEAPKPLFLEELMWLEKIVKVGKGLTYTELDESCPNLF